jgi:hypothetical protein
MIYSCFGQENEKEVKSFPMVARCSGCNHSKTLEDFHISKYKKLVCTRCNSYDPIVYLPYCDVGELDINFLLAYQSGESFDIQRYASEAGPCTYIDNKKCSMCNSIKFSRVSLGFELVNTAFGELPSQIDYNSYAAACSDCGDHALSESQYLLEEQEAEENLEDFYNFVPILEPETDEIPYGENYDDEKNWDIEFSGPDIEDGQYK